MRKNLKKIFDLTNLIEFSVQKKDMKLGENGKEISGGERQRIGFARCLFITIGILLSWMKLPVRWINITKKVF